jgi:hypothetical protein
LKQIKWLSTVVALSCAVSALAQVHSWQVLTLRDKEPALVYEVFYRAGTLKYRESYPNSSENYTYTTPVSTVGQSPVLGYWRSDAHRQDRLFGATSQSPAFSHSTAVSLGTSAAWTFRPATEDPPSAVVLALRGSSNTAGQAGGHPSSTMITLPAHSQARAAVIFRAAVNPIRIDFGNTVIVGDGERGGYVNIATNMTNQPIQLRVTGKVSIPNSPAGGYRNMSIRSKPAGQNVTLLSGNFAGEPDSFAAAVITAPLPQ